MTLLRTKFGNEIIAEFLPPKKTSERVIILCDGIPTVPSKRGLIEFLRNKGFWVFHPRYRGTWESGGEFLDHNPVDDILQVISELQKGEVRSIWDGEVFEIKPASVFVIGASFGGAVAICCATDPRVTKVVAVSPVVDWTKEDDGDEPMNWYGNMMKESFGEAYRFSEENWGKLSRGQLFNPVHELLDLDRRKLFIVHAQDDRIVLPDSVAAFAKSLDCTFLFLRKGGHLSSSCLKRWNIWRRVASFLRA